MAVQLSWTDVSEDAEKLVFTADSSLLLGKDHLLIKEDNLPVLKWASETLEEKINLIYIDPPYNTGNSFIYNDAFAADAWLSFMERRLQLAKRLLSKAGCIFIAIDQTELYHLKLLCDKVFGESNFVNDFMWLHGKGKKDSWSRTLQQHTLCYAKDKKNLAPFTEIQKSNWATQNVDNDSRGAWFSGSISFSEARSNPNHKNYFSVTSPSGKVWTRQWQVSRQKMDELLAENKIYFGAAPEYDKVPREKIFNDTEKEIIPKNIIDCVETTRAAQNHLNELLGSETSFDNPKPVDLIAHLIQITGLPSDSIIMDFFAGSGTTFEAVCKLNAGDGGQRRCILVQKPETPQKQSDWENIASLCEARCQKVASLFNTKITVI